jgi:diguanylate cyclase (GGDEF)-like protein
MFLKPAGSTTSIAIQVILRIALIVGATELLVMLHLNLIGIEPSGITHAIIDATFLVSFASPLIYYFVVRPYIIDREREHENVKFLAHHDELTKLSNRRMLDESLNLFLPALARHGHFGALIYFDLDGFKPINDEYGHETGDLVLIELATRLTNSLRTEEIISRVGGDEFILLVGNAGKSYQEARHQAEKLSNRLSRLVKEAMKINGMTLQIGCSIGVHILTPATKNPQLAIKVADISMYQAKQLKNNSIVFSDSMGKPNYEFVSIGVKEVDDEHQHIDELLAKLFKPDTNRQEVWAEFLAAAKNHFNSEVAVSKRLNLNMTAEHIEEHERILELLSKVSLADDESGVLDQLTTIGQLLQEHILGYDRSLNAGT